MVISVDELSKLLEIKDGYLYWKPRGVKRWDSRYSGKRAVNCNSHGYRAGCILGKKYLAHRVIWALTYREWPDQLDHIDNNRSNNSISNLRLASNQENMFNRKPSLNKSSGFKGVAWHKRTNKWRAYIEKDGNKYYLGYFKNEKEAALAYNKKCLELFGAFARLNEVPW